MVIRSCGDWKALRADRQKWTRRGSNPGPSPCKGDVIPLHHGPAYRWWAGNSWVLGWLFMTWEYVIDRWWSVIRGSENFGVGRFWTTRMVLVHVVHGGHFTNRLLKQMIITLSRSCWEWLEGLNRFEKIGFAQGSTGSPCYIKHNYSRTILFEQADNII